jgi:histidinol dehydrogenase
VLKVQDAGSFRKSFSRRTFADYPLELSRVREIIGSVRLKGDGAVCKFTAEFDGTAPDRLRVSEEEFDSAERLVAGEFRTLLSEAAHNIAAFHRRGLLKSWQERGSEGVILGERVTALDRVGAYVPGGGAAYPSSVLMTVIPAKVAGVREVVVTTPPGAGGQINPYTLMAARLAGADAVYKCGGAQAIAALAYGTETIPAVDKIVGPGNLYVTLAKREVAGIVGIDMLAGPSEVLVLADDTARADFVAADLLAQAEHDVLSAAYCVTVSRRLADELPVELEKQCARLARGSVAGQALAGQGALVLAQDLAEALDVVNMLAPEHLELHLADPWQALEKVRHAGAVFVGAYTPESLGDYWAGPNHVLPTAGSARFYSPLSAADFQKRSSIIHYPAACLPGAALAVETLAAAEGLTAHGLAVKIRREHLEKQDSYSNA